MREGAQPPEYGESSAVETDVDSRELARGGDIVHFIKPRRRRRSSGEPTYQISIRPRVSIVNRFNRLADELRLSNAELLEALLDIYDREKIPS